VKTAGISNQHRSFLEGIQGGVLQADPGSSPNQGKVPLQKPRFHRRQGGQVEALSKRHQTAKYQGETPQAALKNQDPKKYYSSVSVRNAQDDPQGKRVLYHTHTSITRLQTLACCLIPLLIVVYSCIVVITNTTCFLVPRPVNSEQAIRGEETRVP
jgi:hypothetical protein